MKTAVAITALALAGTLAAGSLAAQAIPAQPAAPAAGQADERAAVLAVVQRLFDAMRMRDTVAMKSVFDSTATLVSVRQRRQGPPVVSVTPWREFMMANARDTRGVWDERIYDPEVRIDATLATVWVSYDFYFSNTFSHCGTDAFTLLKAPNGGWRIMMIADTFQREGCPARQRG
jgi:hypothetical protein